MSIGWNALRDFDGSGDAVSDEVVVFPSGGLVQYPEFWPEDNAPSSSQLWTSPGETGTEYTEKVDVNDVLASGDYHVNYNRGGLLTPHVSAANISDGLYFSYREIGSFDRVKYLNSIRNVVGSGDMADPRGNVNLVTHGNDTLIHLDGDGNLSAENVTIALGEGDPSVTQLQQYFDNTGSSGYFTGGELSDSGACTIDVAEGQGFVRETDDDNAALLSFAWEGVSDLEIPDDSTRYVFVDCNGNISLDADEFVEAVDNIIIGVVTCESGSIESVFNLGVRLEESIGQAGRFIRRVHSIVRDIRKGGLVIGETGTRNVTLSAGTLWWGRTEYPITALDTSDTGSFPTYSANGQEASAATQWPNTQYDNAGTLTTMINNRWASLWFYIEPDDHVVMVYGRAQYVTEALAEADPVPTTSLPNRITAAAVLAARILFKKSATTATISSAFATQFVGGAASDHSGLSNLSFASAGHTGFAPASASGDAVMPSFAVPDNIPTFADGSGRALQDSGVGFASGVTVVSSGDVVGPTPVLDNAMVRFDGTTGRKIKSSGIIADDSDNVSKISSLSHTEKASAEADVAGQGQYWTKDAAPNVPMFTSDTGGNFLLAQQVRTDPGAWDWNVGDFTIDGAYHDFDLSGILPVTASWVYMKMKLKNTNVSEQIHFRKNGNVNVHGNVSPNILVAGVNHFIERWIPCDSSQIIEYSATNAGTWNNLDLVILGWH